MNKLYMVILNPAYYTISAILALMIMYGIYLMSKVEKAKLGNGISAVAVLFGVILSLVKYNILSIWMIYLCLAVGIIIGLYIAVKVKMIEMPQLIALLNGLGGLSSMVVGSYALLGIGAGSDGFSVVTAMLATAIGGLTFTGSLIATGKLHKIINQKRIELKMHELILVTLMVLIALVMISKFAINLNVVAVLVSLIILSFAFGILFAIRIGGADMPIVISLLNSLSGFAAAISGFAIGDVLLVSIGAMVGASGLLLTQIMCSAMNRNLYEILIGKKSTVKISESIEKEELHDENEEKVDYREIVKTAKNIIIVPGYGMAVAQAQHVLKLVADQFKLRGAHIRYAIHPVAGRMPGHMNVLLAEANIDYDEFFEMDEVNDDFKNVDLVIVVGANDVLNPAARHAQDTPIYGMPILNVDQAKHIFIFNYDLGAGYSGVANPIYQRKHGVDFFLGNALDTLTTFLADMKR